MNEDKIERAIQFLLDNQAGHDARLARLEETMQKMGETVDKLGEKVDKSGGTVDKLGGTVSLMSEDLYGGLGQMHEGIDKLTALAEQTMLMVQQVTHNQVAGNRRLTDAEGRLDKVEDALNM